MPSRHWLTFRRTGRNQHKISENSAGIYIFYNTAILHGLEPSPAKNKLPTVTNSSFLLGMERQGFSGSWNIAPSSSYWDKIINSIKIILFLLFHLLTNQILLLPNGQWGYYSPVFELSLNSWEWESCLSILSYKPLYSTWNILHSLTLSKYFCCSF